MDARMIEAVFFDFGGVIAEEGFRKGLESIAEDHSLDPAAFFQAARSLVYSSGFVTGTCGEDTYWDQLRRQTGITGEDAELRQRILDRFIIRPWMLDIVQWLKGQAVKCFILSDQTNWLDELDRQYHFSRHFDRVFNSFHIGKSKADPTLFSDILSTLRLEAGSALFVDDSAGNVARASGKGLHAVQYSDKEKFLKDISGYFPGIEHVAR
jgi:putative hydrolase of the HAD superfamily